MMSGGWGAALPVAVQQAFMMNDEREEECVSRSSEWTPREGRVREWGFLNGRRYVWRDSAPDDVEVTQ